jgi:hypothetical protein
VFFSGKGFVVNLAIDPQFQQASLLVCEQG